MTTEIFRSPYAVVTQEGSRYYTSIHGEEGPSYDDLTKAVQFASLQSMVAGAERARDAYELSDHITSILKFVSANPHLRRSLGYFKMFEGGFPVPSWAGRKPDPHRRFFCSWIYRRTVCSLTCPTDP